jgi:hypothetical protein
MVRTVRKALVDQVAIEEVPISSIETPSSYQIGDPKDPLTPSFECTKEGNVFAIGKCLSISKTDEGWSLVLEHGVIDKFLLLKWLRPRTTGDISGLLTSPNVPFFNLSFPYQDHPIKSLIEEPSSYPLSYEFFDCVIKDIDLKLIPGTHIAFSRAAIEAKGLRSINKKTYIKESSAPQESQEYQQVDFY